MITLNKTMKSKKEYLTEIVEAIKSKQSNAKVKKLVVEMKHLGLDINSKRYRGRTLLHYAVKYHNVKIVSFLVKSGVNLEICDDDYQTPLHYAISLNDSQMVKELINEGADVNATSSLELTPLHIAITTSNLEIVKILVAHGADKDLVDEKNLRPIDYAIDEKNTQIIEYLSK